MARVVGRFYSLAGLWDFFASGAIRAFNKALTWLPSRARTLRMYIFESARVS